MLKNLTSQITNHKDMSLLWRNV